MIRVRNLFVGLAIAAAACASAQMPPGFEMPSLWYNPALMMVPAVQKELHVSQAVAQKAMTVMMQEGMKVQSSVMGAMKGQAPTVAQMKAASAALNRMSEASVKDLNPAQRARLHEITLQSYGPKAMLDPKVAAQVGLSPKQVADLRAAESKATMSQRSKMQAAAGGKGFDMGGMQSAAKNSRKLVDAALKGILTPKQQAKWKALQGKQIDLGPLGEMMGG